MLFTNAGHIGFPSGTFDLALCGFMGWDDCFDYNRLEFTRPDIKAKEIRRVLKDGGRFVCCSWEAQEDLAWMEEAMERYYPSLLTDNEYMQERTVGMAHEKAPGYEIILHSAGFHNIEVTSEVAEFISTDEEEFWQQMEQVGWQIFFEKIEKVEPRKLLQIKHAIFHDLEDHKQVDGIHFTKSVFYVSGIK